jgi:hypothetical protein
LPQLLFIVRHEYTDEARAELLTTALQIVRLTNSIEFFNRIVTLMFTMNHGCGLAVVALFADVADSFKVLQLVLRRAIEFSSDKGIICDFLAASAIIAASTSIDIMATLFKLLSTQYENTAKWHLAAACVALYVGRQSQFLPSQFQAAFDVVQSMKSPAMRSIFMIILSELIPVHLRSALVDLMKQTLFPAIYRSIEGDRTTMAADVPDDAGVPLLVRAGVAKSIATIAAPEQLSGLPDPLLTLVARSGPRARTPSGPVSPFIACSVSELGRLASALAFRASRGKTDVIGVRRPFVAVSPPFHALTVEVASVVSAVRKSLCIDLRISGKGVIPSIVVIIRVPESLTPPLVPEWHVKHLIEGVNVTRRFRFTVENPKLPFADIRIRQEDVDILDIRVCLPLIDLFVRTVPEEKELERAIWEKLKYEQEQKVDSDDAIWVTPSACIAVKNKVARASQKALLALLQSAAVTCAVLN